MTEMTALDSAHAAMSAEGAPDGARLQFYERLADAEVFVLLTGEAHGDQIEPEVFQVVGTGFVLVFDRESRLTDFVGQVAPYAALSGRAVASMLAGKGIGLGLNLEVAPSSILIPPDAIDWLDQMLGHAPENVETKIEVFSAPKGLPPSLISALDTKLAIAAGLARSAYLVGVTYAGSGSGHLLGFVDAKAGAEGALAQAAHEALTFSGIEAGALDVGFFAASDPVAAHLARAGLRFDLPESATPTAHAPGAPGRDPAKPPKLR
jgi:hypothetical protein